MTHITTASLTSEIINPVISATIETFDMMLGVKLRKTSLKLVQRSELAFHPLTAVIQLSGPAHGSICLSLERRTAFTLVYKLLGESVCEMTPVVIDAAGELVNIIAGTAERSMEHLDLQLGLPSIVGGSDISFPSGAVPMAAHFTSNIGRLIVAFAFVNETGACDP